MGVSYSPFGYTRAAFKSTDYNLTTLKTNRAEFLIDSTWNQNYTGYSFTNQNDLIIHYEEYLGRSIPGFTKFDLNAPVDFVPRMGHVVPGLWPMYSI